MIDGPPWLLVLGRAHPLLVHLPIGLLVALAALELAARRHDVTRARQVLALLATATALATAGSGWLLGHAPDRAETATLELHETLGLIVAGLSLPLAWFARGGPRALLGYRLSLLAVLAVLLPAGHVGATLTHGEDWLLGPLHEPPGAETLGDASAAGDSRAAPDYAADVAPIFAARCGACHDAGRHKGGLVVLSPEGLRAGGRDGPVLEVGADGLCEMQRRLQRPLEDEDHMPPGNKPQLVPRELAVLEAWLTAGAPFGAGSSALAPVGRDAAPAGRAPAGRLPVEPLPPAADPAALAALREALVHVEPVEPRSTLLLIDVAAIAPGLDDDRAAALLAPVAPQVAELSLARAPVGDALLPRLGLMPHLARLDLRGTRVTAAGLRTLAGHARLEELVLARTALGDAAVEALLALPALRRLNVWGAGLSPDGLARLRAARPALAIEADESPEAPVLEQEPPVTVGAASPGVGAAAPKAVNTTCPVSGEPVDPAFTVLFEGRLIGFCCPKCPAQFWADPAKYVGKLP